MLEARSLSCVRGTRLLFEHINLRVAPGEVFQVCGANGAGKTSLLRLLCGLTLPERGEILWGGLPISADLARYHGQLAYVGHTPGLKFDLTARENLEVTLAMQPARDQADLDQVLERVGLSSSAHIICRHLSAGQRRRVAIARLHLTSASLWILDEPLSAIDAEGVSDIESILIAHLEAGGMVIFTSHQAIELARYSIDTVNLAG